jgi:hypothetical protein
MELMLSAEIVAQVGKDLMVEDMGVQGDRPII